MLNEALALLIPIVAIVMSIGVAFWAIYWDFKKKKLQYDERRLMIEKGMTPAPIEIPPENKPLTLQDRLRRGTIMVFLAIGFTIAHLVLVHTPPTGDDSAPQLAWLLAVAAAIVGLIGVGNVVYYVIAKRTNAEAA